MKSRVDEFIKQFPSYEKKRKELEKYQAEINKVLNTIGDKPNERFQALIDMLFVKRKEAGFINENVQDLVDQAKCEIKKLKRKYK